MSILVSRVSAPQTREFYLHVVQGSNVTILLAAEPYYGEEFPVETLIGAAKFQDPKGNTVTKITSDPPPGLEKVLDEVDVKLYRCVLSSEDTLSLEPGILQIELAIDDFKVRYPHAIKILEGIVEEGS